jgi:acyl carrier protein
MNVNVPVFISRWRLNMEFMEELNRIFCLEFDDDDIRIAPKMTANDIEGWDSLLQVNLIVAIVTKFNFWFTQKVLLAFRNVGDLMNCTRCKMVDLR